MPYSHDDMFNNNHIFYQKNGDYTRYSKLNRDKKVYRKNHVIPAIK